MNDELLLKIIVPVAVALGGALFQAFFAQPSAQWLKEKVGKIRLEFELDVITLIHCKSRTEGHGHQYPSIIVCKDGRCAYVRG